MKHKLIKTDNYLFVVNDSEIKVGDWFYYKHFGEDIISQAKENTELVNLNKSDRFFRKITTHLPLNNSPILQGVDLLPPFEQEDDVEKLAKEFFKPELPYQKKELEWNGFIKGYNKAD